jgi:amino acid adenylation domain-containing protein
VTDYLAVLAELDERGLQVSAVGSDLRLQGPRERMDADLVDRIKEVKPELVAYLAAGSGKPLTPLQLSYLAGRADVFEMGNVASYVYHEIEGHWDVDRLEEALNAVIAEHDALRGRFTPQQTQVWQPAAHTTITRVDLREEGDSGLAAQRARWTHRILPAGRAPLLAAEVSVLSDDRMVLHVGHDGLVMDGISMFLFFRAWWAHYSGAARPAEEMSFESYVDSLDEARDRKPYARSREYWLDRLDTLPEHPRLPLAADPSSIDTPRYTQRVVRVPAERWTALKELAARAGLTPSALLFAAYTEVLATWGAEDRFTVVATVANRPPVHPRILESIGQYSDPLLVAVDLDRSLTFAERARVVQDRLRTDLDHRHFSGVEVMRELGRRQGSQVRMPFTFNGALGYPLSGVDGSALELFGPEAHTVSQTPQVWLNAFAMEQHGDAVVQLDGVAQLFPDGLLDDLAEGYQRLLDHLADPEAWHRTRLDMLPAAQRARRTAANDTARPRADTLAHQPFLARAADDPDRVAVLTSGLRLSYGELYRRVSAAAEWLRAAGVGRDQLVGLVMTRGPEQIIGIMATLLAGGAYLPVDAVLPAARQQKLLDDGEVRCVLTNAGWRDPSGRRAVLTLDAAAEPGAVREVPSAADAHPDDLAYVLFTSGTTGKPKGVMISHRSVANLVADCADRFAVGPDDRWFAVSSFAFDLSVYDVFGALSSGGAIVIPDHDRATDAGHWLDMCADGGVTIWNSVPQIVALLHEQAVADGRLDALASLRLVMMSGDRIPPDLPVALRASLHGLTAMSLGGPTETTVWNVVHPIGPEDDGSRPVPYGRPNENNQLYVLGPADQDMPDWVVGEITASGAGLARGYWRDRAATDRAFRVDKDRGVRLYRTGDLGRYLPSGEIDILGRTDFQLKVNGYRVEAGEVETLLAALDGVRQAAVVRQAGSHGDRLVGHVVADGDRPDDEWVRAALREQLPAYCVPAVLVWHDALPLTRNGKVDRAALSAAALPGGDADRGRDLGAELADDLERELAELWHSVLDMPDIDAVTRLADLGADSLAAARILAGVRKRYKVTIRLPELAQTDTVRAMAARIGGAR